MCTHENQLNVRLITYTRYGPMCGCLVCGTSWIVRTDEREASSSPAAAKAAS